MEGGAAHGKLCTPRPQGLENAGRARLCADAEVRLEAHCCSELAALDHPLHRLCMPCSPGRLVPLSSILLAACNMSLDTVVNNFYWEATSLTRPVATWSWSQRYNRLLRLDQLPVSTSQMGWRRFGER
ncbi:hypothetical protein QYE76_052298 [Lolium multiflorum]|uniref:Uncharacterized protein n=1 Tax=Lolium multiflorum TaxID=4521 RepID=A0AAD8SUS3_LOLMU|nr:hypothetical protein QYE76_052298 [Lolium multiflorum]